MFKYKFYLNLSGPGYLHNIFYGKRSMFATISIFSRVQSIVYQSSSFDGHASLLLPLYI